MLIKVWSEDQGHEVSTEIQTRYLKTCSNLGKFVRSNDEKVDVNLVCIFLFSFSGDLFLPYFYNRISP